jgi:hypothetical protein
VDCFVGWLVEVTFSRLLVGFITLIFITTLCLYAGHLVHSLKCTRPCVLQSQLYWISFFWTLLHGCWLKHCPFFPLKPRHLLQHSFLSVLLFCWMSYSLGQRV